MRPDALPCQRFLPEPRNDVQVGTLIAAVPQKPHEAGSQGRNMSQKFGPEL